MAIVDGRVRSLNGVVVPTGWPRALWVTGTILLVTMYPNGFARLRYRLAE